MKTSNLFLTAWILITTGLLLISCSSSIISSSPTLEPTAVPRETSTPIVLPPTWTLTSSPEARTATPSHTSSPTSTMTQPPSATPEGTSGTGTETAPAPEIERITLVPPEEGYEDWREFESETARFLLPNNYWPFFMQETNEGWYKVFARGFLDPYSKTLALLYTEYNPTPTPDPRLDYPDLTLVDFYIVFDSDRITSIVLISEPVEENTTLAEQFDRIEKEFGQGYRVMEKHLIDGGDYESGRMIFKFREDPLQPSGMQIMYLFLEKGRLWSLSYNTPIELYQDIVLMSEKSAESFEIVP